MDEVATLLEQLKGVRADGQAAQMRAIAALVPSEAADRALGILEHMDAAHGALVGMEAAEILVDHGRPEQLDRLVAARARLPALEGLRDWRQDVGHAIAVLRARARGACGCAAITTGNNAPASERFETLARTHDDASDEQLVRCRSCGRVFQVVTEEGYHFPVYQWRSGSSR